MKGTGTGDLYAGDRSRLGLCIEGRGQVMYMEGTGLGLGLCIEGTGDVYNIMEGTGVYRRDR